MARRNPEVNRAFGQLIRDARLAAELSQESLAAACEVHPTYISHLERGRSSPSLEVICALADALGVSAGALVGEASESAS